MPAARMRALSLQTVDEQLEHFIRIHEGGRSSQVIVTWMHMGT